MNMMISYQELVRTFPNGIILNRMNSASLDNLISSVKIKGNGKGVGVKFKNTTGSTQLSGMRFEKLESSYH
ncbi:hypothetical protein, partial [Klebsiella pneumoniae]